MDFLFIFIVDLRRDVGRCAAHNAIWWISATRNQDVMVTMTTILLSYAIGPRSPGVRPKERGKEEASTSCHVIITPSDIVFYWRWPIFPGRDQSDNSGLMFISRLSLPDEGSLEKRVSELHIWYRSRFNSSVNDCHELSQLRPWQWRLFYDRSLLTMCFLFLFKISSIF